MAIDNKSLGRFILDGIPPAPRGVPQIEVTFDLDASGIIHVSAKDKTSGKEQKIKIEGGTGLSQEEIDKMVKDAQLHAEEDKKKKEQIEARNIADNMCHAAEKALKDSEGKLTEEIVSDITAKVKGVRDVLSTASTEELKQKTEELSSAMQKIGEHLAKQSQTGTEEQGNDPKREGPEDEVTEGEVVQE